MVVTDMDGTLTKTSIVLDHAGVLIENGIIKDDGSYYAWKDDVKNEKLIVAVAENYRHQLTGMKVSDLMVEEFVTNSLADHKNWYTTLDTITNMKNCGHEVVILSGSSDFLVEEVARQLGFVGVGSHYHTDENGCLTGGVDGMFHAQAKSDWIEGHVNFDKTEILGFGDTSSDYGIAEHSAEFWLVEPTTQTVEFFKNKQLDYKLWEG